MVDLKPTQPLLPQPDALTAPFWDTCCRQSLEVPSCDDCGHRFLPPGPCCPRCWSPRITPLKVCGRGRVFSFVVYRRSYHAAMPAPYVVALIQLKEGPRLISNVVGCTPEDVTINMEVELRFKPSGDLVLPLFTPLCDDGKQDERRDKEHKRLSI